jgi:hypothetical protein
MCRKNTGTPFPFPSFLGSGEGLDLSGVVVAGQDYIETGLLHPFDDVPGTNDGPVEFNFSTVEGQRNRDAEDSRFGRKVVLYG